jgi:PIN domain nuclease of toxin-antitoxin system
MNHWKTGKRSPTMTHLLDTNVWLRVVARPDELSPAARMLMNQRNILPFGLSAISIWEVTLKARKRKLELLPTADRWLQSALNRSLVEVLPIDATIARLANELPGTFHEDPADRLIAATALQLNLAVVTSDMNFRSYDAVRSIW